MGRQMRGREVDEQKNACLVHERVGVSLGWVDEHRDAVSLRTGQNCLKLPQPTFDRAYSVDVFHNE